VNVSDFYRGVYIFQLRDKNGRMIDSGKFQVSHWSSWDGSREWWVFRRTS